MTTAMMAAESAALPSADAPALLDAKQAARLCGIGLSSWYNLVAAGKTPASVRLGRRVLWRRDELLRWIEAGCPARAKWDALTAKKK